MVEADAQAHLAARGFANRQIRNITANKGTRYENKIVGDSPEMCRALDSHGFADLKAPIVKYASFTSLYPAGDPRRFNLGTPPELFHSIQRTWAVAPTMRRIIEDVMALPRVLDVVIAARGCVVQMRSSGTCGMVAAVKESARRAEKSAPRAHCDPLFWCS